MYYRDISENYNEKINTDGHDDHDDDYEEKINTDGHDDNEDEDDFDYEKFYKNKPYYRNQTTQMYYPMIYFYPVMWNLQKRDNEEEKDLKRKNLDHNYDYRCKDCENHRYCMPMMNMQGMNCNCMYGMHPMMEINEMSQMKPMYRQDNDDNIQFSIPMLVKLEQISPNQIQISYDRDVDVMLGMKPTNYWIQDTMNARPAGIATLGRNDNVNAGNSLTGNMVKIESKNGSAKTFILTFNRVIPRGAQYKFTPPYSGDNGMATFIGK